MARTGRDLTGQKFGKLTVLGFGGYEQIKRQRVAMWNCHCDCGSDCQVEGYLLVSGRRKKLRLYPEGSRSDGGRALWKTGGSGSRS